MVGKAMPKIRVNSIEIYYELQGQSGKPVLVLNNGILMNAASSWVFQKEALAQNFRLLLYDCRGQGQSDHPQSPYSMELHADDLAGLLTALGIEAAHIAGISYGGEVAQALTLKYPSRVKSLILADTVSQVEPALRIIVQSWLDAARRGDARAFFNVTVPWNFSPQFIAANPGLLKDARKRYDELDFPAVVRLCECFLEVDFTSRLHEIQAPTCIVVGSADLLKGPEYALVLQQHLPQAELHILTGAGHASCWERPQEFNSVVLGFLAKNT
jgi:3-oxoadipate enol-lactonase